MLRLHFPNARLCLASESTQGWQLGRRSFQEWLALSLMDGESPSSHSSCSQAVPQHSAGAPSKGDFASRIFPAIFSPPLM